MTMMMILLLGQGVAVFDFWGSDPRGKEMTMKANMFCSKRENSGNHGGRINLIGQECIDPCDKLTN